jgi:hypothetical protein
MKKMGCLVHFGLLGGAMGVPIGSLKSRFMHFLHYFLFEHRSLIVNPHSHREGG